MLTKSIEVEVDAGTWGGEPVPRFISGGAGIQNINLLAALFMLGNLTMPNILSVGSPARFWAWMRYFLAPASSQELRIIMPFAELDPHQKGILSDDFGVAISTQWLFDRLGGFRQIVDGRWFVLNLSHLLVRELGSKAKVGSSKIPDFVVEDNNGKWHVLECKGTQSGIPWRDRFLTRAVQQKHVINMRGELRGQRLAAGLAISNENQAGTTHLKIIDPEPEPLISLGVREREEARQAAARLTIARAVGILGLSDAAIEFSFPEEIDLKMASPFMTRSERFRTRRSRKDRIRSANEQLRSAPLEAFKEHGGAYRGREVFFDIPENLGNLSGAKIRVRQGISGEILDELGDSFVKETVPGQSSDGVEIQAGDDYVILRCGSAFYSDLSISRKK